MKKLYSIGETAKIIGISTQALRNYSNMDLVKPETINFETGYRYYSFSQLHYIDRIKYLRSLGLSLKEIADILNDGKPEKMIYYLCKKKSELISQINNINLEIEEIDWYINYFKQLDKIRITSVPYIKQFPERYMLYISCEDKNYDKEDIEIEMMKLKNSSMYNCHRQWGIAIDFKKYLLNQFVPKKYFFFIKDKQKKYNSKHVEVIPAGLYLCLWCSTKLNIDTHIVKSFYKEHDKPSYALALEFENSFINYTNCPYEYQTLIQKNV